MREPDFLLFASDATWAVLAGGALLLVAIAATVAERRRLRRTRIDAVGWVPWTTVFFVCFLLGVLLLGLAGRTWLQG